MQIEIERFGPVSSFVCDLDKDLVIIYGNNNIGKSYFMQIIYLLLKSFTEKDSGFSVYGSMLFYKKLNQLPASEGYYRG